MYRKMFQIVVQDFNEIYILLSFFLLMRYRVKFEPDKFLCEPAIPNFIEIRSVVSEIKHSDGQTCHVHNESILCTSYKNA
jgi:hypothetical protein